MVRIRVRGWVIHYVHESPYKDSRSTRVFVCVFKCVFNHVCVYLAVHELVFRLISSEEGSRRTL